MKIRRQINKLVKLDKIAKIQEKQMARYTKIREQVKDKTKEELNLLLLSKNVSKTDRYAIIHTIKKIDDSKVSTDTITDVNSEHKLSLNDSTNNNNALSGETTSIKEEKS